MCGIVGIVRRDAVTPDELLDSVVPMARSLVHRGPDGEGYWLEASCGVALGHRRLAIIDLTDSGRQPMESASGRFVVVFNGEIYNFQELRKTISATNASQWRGHSDTEVLLAAFESWGIYETLRRLNGMFAIGVWDRQSRCLTLARDRFGEKPLYYGKVGDTLVFASETTALACLPQFDGNIDARALAGFFQYGFVPGTSSIYESIRKLPPASLLSVRVDPGAPLHWGDPVEYWSAAAVAADSREFAFADPDDARDTLEQKLSQSVRIRLESDVPLGVFLSGGIDSTVVAALVQQHLEGSASTFTIAFADRRHNEASFASAVATHLGTRHTEILVTPEDCLAVAPDIARFYDEPFADASQLPTYIVCRAARQHVSVALSGDGGDELFGGYNRYFVAPAMWKLSRRMPRWFRNIASGAMRAMSVQSLDRLVSLLRPVLGDRRTLGVSGDRIKKILKAWDATSPIEMYLSLVNAGAGGIVRAGNERQLDDVCRKMWHQDWSPAENMMLVDTLFVLPGDFLVKVDRAAMAVSLETRTPFLDPEVFASAWRVPDRMRFTSRQGKLLLRQIAYRHVPREILDRPKQGFGIPLDAWLRGPLREWAADTLGLSGGNPDEYLDQALVREMWEQHQAGTHDRQQQLWTALMFLGWRRSQGVKTSRTRSRQEPVHVTCR